MHKATGSIVVALALTLIAASADAKDITGRFGLGYDRPLAGAGGLAALYQLVPKVGIQAILGFDTVSSESDDTDTQTSVFRLGGALRGVFTVVSTEPVNLGIAGGFSYATVSSSREVAGAETDGGIGQLSIEVAMRPEWFVADFFSLHTQVGLSVSLIDTKADLGPYGGGEVETSATALSLGPADVLSNVGFTFWF